MYHVVKNRKSIVIIAISSLFYGCAGSAIEIEKSQSKNINKSETPYRMSLEVLGDIQKNSKSYGNSFTMVDAVQCFNADEKKGIKCDLKDSELLKIKNPNIIAEIGKLSNGAVISEDLLKLIAKDINYKNLKSKKNSEKDLSQLKDSFSQKIYANKGLTRYFRIDEIKNSSSNTKIDTIDLQNLIKTALANVDNYQVVNDAENDNQVGSNVQYKISGSITGYDNVNSKGNDQRADAYGGKGLGEFGLEASNRDSIEHTEMSLDLFVSKRNSNDEAWKIVKRVTSSNKLILEKNTKDNSYGIRIFGIGVNFGENVVTEDGIGYATRLLVEKSLVELLAKLDDLDYTAFEPLKYCKVEVNGVNNQKEDWSCNEVEGFTPELFKGKEFYLSEGDNKIKLVDSKECKSKCDIKDSSWEWYLKSYYKTANVKEKQKVFLESIRKSSEVNNDYLTLRSIMKVVPRYLIEKRKASEQ
jgi:hypothetical protein